MGKHRVFTLGSMDTFSRITVYRNRSSFIPSQKTPKTRTIKEHTRKGTKV